MAKYIYTGLMLMGIGFLLGLNQNAKAQQDPQYSHYMFNPISYNPAFAGRSQNRICATFLNHSQWTGFEGTSGGQAPETQVLNAHAPLANEYVHGTGLSVYNDQAGFENTVSIKAAGMHELELPFAKLALGLDVGIIQKSFDPSDLETVDTDPTQDPLIPNSETSDIMPTVGIGGYLHNDQYFAGLSAQHLIEPDFGWSTEGDSKFNRHYYLTGGYNYSLNENWDFQPTALVKFDGSKWEEDINVRGILRDKFWGGLGYRINESALTGMVGMNITPKLKLGYSFDLGLDPGDVKSGGTHEIMVGYCFRFDPEPKEEFPIWTPRFL